MGMLQFLGHSAFYVEGSGIKALIDPFLSGNPCASEASTARASLDYIFVSHAHGDHLGDAVAIAERTGATVVATNELATWLAGRGLKTEGMHIGGRARFPFGRVKLTPAFHGSSMFEDGKMIYSDIPCGFLIEVEEKKIYHAGDTGLTVEMTLLEAEGVDVALIPIGGYYVMDVDDAVRAVDFIKPRRTVPIHYDTFPPIKADPNDFARKVGGRSEVTIMKPGDKLPF
ncbi:MAG: metal-dependent hydrolase [Synergistaceae bacterium]|jgi:L-ascorbate metabolism protein UlaG (beta-lactamase superfamily)|nr:metal-dependent hydrolase [Synergistaceae bacterium]